MSDELDLTTRIEGLGLDDDLKDILVRLTSGESISVPCRSSDTAADLKRKVLHREAERMDCRLIRADSKPLRLEKTLAENGVSHGQLLQLVMGLQGGGT
eukprot:COSAG05_NODE_530_length_8907_cov_8.972298_10_plen_99_part_00